jgi:hypothetical protein
MKLFKCQVKMQCYDAMLERIAKMIFKYKLKTPSKTHPVTERVNGA